MIKPFLIILCFVFLIGYLIFFIITRFLKKDNTSSSATLEKEKNYWRPSKTPSEIINNQIEKEKTND
jgi:hypothetical protein